jgi:hypothetical protein
MRGSKSATILKSLVIFGSAFYLLHSFIYGAGRGISAVPAGHEGLALLKLVTYFFLLIGAIFYPKHPRVAAALLWAGVIGRGVLEFETSVAKAVMAPVADWHLGFVLLVLLMYTVTFVLPFLLALDALRLLRGSNATEKSSGEQAVADQLPAREE